MKITLDHVAKTFHTFRAVHDVSLEIKSGELIALLGPSGSGKTTLLRMVAGLEFPDSGHILFGEADATNIAVRERGVGFVFQHYALFPHMTIAENIAFGMKTKRARKRSKAEIDARVQELLSLVQLPQLGDRFPVQISGGQKQRVALARALAVDPKVLLLDEPFGALDANVRRDLRRWLRKIHDDLGITTLFVTHDQEEALDLADRVLILKQGQIEQLGTPREVCTEPASSFVMQFLGDTHILKTTVKDGKATFGGRIFDASHLKDGPAEIYIRPDDLIWQKKAKDTIEVSVTRIMDRPGKRRLIVATKHHEILELDVAPEIEVAIDDTGYLGISRARIFLCRRDI